MSTEDTINGLRAFALQTDDNRADALCTGAAALIEKLEAEIASLNRSMDAADLCTGVVLDDGRLPAGTHDCNTGLDNCARARRMQK